MLLPAALLWALRGSPWAPPGRLLGSNLQAPVGLFLSRRLARFSNWAFWLFHKPPLRLTLPQLQCWFNLLKPPSGGRLASIFLNTLVGLNISIYLNLTFGVI